MSTTYSGWRNERIGIIGSASLIEVVLVLLVSLPGWFALSVQHWITGLLLLVAAVACAVLVFVQVHERQLYRWVSDSGLQVVGRVSGASRWRAKAATGHFSSEDLKKLDLPGALQSLKVHDGPPHAGSGMRRVCLIQDGERNWTLTASARHPGLSMADPTARGRYAEGLGQMVSAVARAERGVQRVSIYVRTVPESGAERAAWHHEHARDDLPATLVSSTDELEGMILASSVAHEIYVTVRFREDLLAKEARSAGGGVSGRAAVMYRSLPGIEAGLVGCGCQDISWLSTGLLAAAIRTGYNPSETGALGIARAEQARGRDSFADVEPVGAGPSEAPAPRARSYAHDAYRTASYCLLLPDLGTQVGRLAPLLTPAVAGERRCLALHYEPMSVKDAQTQLDRDTSKTQMSTELKRSKGFKISERHKRMGDRAKRQEQQLAAGHTLVRVAGVVAVTVSADQEIETNAALLEASARSGGYSLMRLDLSQDLGFVAAVLPLGIGLPDRS